ncbi:MAG: 4Fe-4S binding protein [Desulfohalobiaceae bacterium]
MEHCIVYCSPAGTTRKVAQSIGSRLQEMGREAVLFDLASNSPESIMQVFSGFSGLRCLWLGTPVYAQHAVPLVQQFLQSLPLATGNCAAVPWVTWGAVSSGLALLEMGDQLVQKGYVLAGAGKVVAEHSSMWRLERPLGQGRPDEEDLAQVRGLVDRVLSKMDSKQWQPLSLDVLDYQPEWLKDKAAQMSIEELKKIHPGYSLDEASCTQCGICEQECPAGAIRLDPYPQRDESCFLCNNCARLCPEGAIHIDLAPIEQRIQEMAQANPEAKETKIWA